MCLENLAPFQSPSLFFRKVIKNWKCSLAVVPLLNLFWLPEFNYLHRKEHEEFLLFPLKKSCKVSHETKTAWFCFAALVMQASIFKVAVYFTFLPVSGPEQLYLFDPGICCPVYFILFLLFLWHYLWGLWCPVDNWEMHLASSIWPAYVRCETISHLVVEWFVSGTEQMKLGCFCQTLDINRDSWRYISLTSSLSCLMVFSPSVFSLPPPKNN